MIGPQLPILLNGDGDFSPYRLPGLAAAYTGRDRQYTADASNRVSQWYDVSGNSGTRVMALNGVYTNYLNWTAITAFGTGDFTVSAKIKVNQIAGGNRVMSGIANALDVYIATNGAIQTGKSMVGSNTASTGVIAAFQTAVITYVRSGTTGTYYIDGVAAGTTADANNYSVGVSVSGRFGGVGQESLNPFNGIIFWERVYSTALGAAAVAADASGTVQSACVLDIDFSTQNRGATSFTSGTRGGASAIAITVNSATNTGICGERDLLQATGANQPLLLPWSGSNYLYLPGVGGNYISTPNSVAVNITGDIDLRVCAACVDWTPASAASLMAKWTAGQQAWAINLNTNGTIQFYINTSLRATSSAANTFTDGTIGWIRITRAQTSGDIIFYTSTDGTTWTQLGTTQNWSAGTAITSTTSAIEVGSNSSGSVAGIAGAYYRAQIYNGINGTLVADFNPSLALNNAATVTASTGEVWTVASTGAKPAQIVGLASMLFDGSAYYLKSAPFTLNQPTTVYLVGKQNTWSANHRWSEGNANNSMAIFQDSSSPNVGLHAGSTVADVPVPLITNGVITAVFNGASSSNRLNRGTAVTGNAGAANASGFTLAAQADGTVPGNFQASEVLIFSQAHDTATQDRIIRWLGARNAINV